MLEVYLLAILSLLIGIGAIWMALIPAVPVSWLYWHALTRKPLVWAIFVGTLVWAQADARFSPALIGPLLLMALGIVLTYRLHQSTVFNAIDFPPQADAKDLPLSDDMEIAVVTYGGVSRAYALDHLIHHHIINDRFGERVVAVTYCAMCRSIIPFDVTGIGPFFVGSYKNANMIVADRKTRTFFQQATFKSLIGRLHPLELTMVPYEMLTWTELRKSGDVPKFARFTENDLRPFDLPLPGIWGRIVASEATPGVSARHHDKRLPARTLVAGIREKGLPPVAIRTGDVQAKGIVALPDLQVAMVSAGRGVNAYSTRTPLGALDLELTGDGRLRDKHRGSAWTIRGKAVSGPDFDDLRLIAVSNEYWFSWKLFHPDAVLVGT